jgi:hypothetical protein
MHGVVGLLQRTGDVVIPLEYLKETQANVSYVTL